MGIYDHLSEEDKERAIDKNKRMLYGKWKIVLADPKYNDYVKDIFQKGDFALWMALSPEPLYFAIHNRNIEMVRFFSKPKGIFGPFMERYTYSPVGVAIIIQDMEIIKFYLDNHLVDMIRKDAQGLNMFHYPFIGLGNDDKKGKILNLLFEKKYFPKISHLLNEPNNTNSTAFDHFLKDDTFAENMNKRTMERFLEKGAVPLQLAHLFLQQELTTDLDIAVKYVTYKSKLMIKKDKEIGEDDYKKIEKKDYTEDGKKIEKRIISNIKAYYCNKAFSNGST